VFRLMVFAIRHGVLGYEAMDLHCFLISAPFGVLSCEATRPPHFLAFELSHLPHPR